MKNSLSKLEHLTEKKINSGIEVGDPGKILPFKKIKSGMEVSDPGKDKKQEKRLNFLNIKAA